MNASIPPFFAGEPLPPLEDILSRTSICSLPMNVKFRGVTQRETVLIEGPAGWGEFAPFPEYAPAEASSWLACALESAWLGFPKPRREQVPLNSTVPAVAASDVADVLSKYHGEIREVKVKVAEKGQSLKDDVARLRAVAQLLPEARLKVDANGGWSEDEAAEAILRFEEFDLLYVEQPVATVDGLARVRERLHGQGVFTLIAADESVRKAEDPLEVARLGAADLLIIKAAPLGGMRRALGIVDQAGLPAVVSSALESSVGIRMGAALAAALPELPFGCGLGTVSLLKEDTAAEPYVAVDGMLSLRTVEPDRDRLKKLAPSAERQEWWFRRISDCYQMLVR